MINLSAPRYKLLSSPTPLQRLERTELKLGREGLYVKRDDQMEVALGGNKLRSLEFWVGEALQESADVLLVAGQPASNQCRLTAAAASIAGLDCIIFHNSDMDTRAQKESFPNKIFGASVRFLGPIDENQRAAAVNQAADELKRQGRKPYIVGNAIVGAMGYVLAAQELEAQARERGVSLRHVILPGSMGPTEAGFIFGNSLLGHPFDVHLVSVEYGQAELAARIDKIFRGLVERTGKCKDGYDDERLHFHMDYLGESYGTPTPECEQAILSFARTEGIFLEHTYTGKTFAGFLDLVQRRVFPEGEAVCVIHTGGVPSLFSQYRLFKTIEW